MSQVSWAGKTLVPFVTDGGWPGSVIDDMRAAATGANVVEPMEVRFDSTGGDRMVTAQAEIDDWMRRVKAALQG